MKLTIIIPVFNVEMYIHRCLDSVFLQDRPADDFEVVVVNDGTPDNSMKIVEKFADTYPNLTILNQQNQGLSAARNTGIKAAKGDYIWFVDSDDRIEVNCLSKILNHLDQYPADILALDFLWIFSNNQEKRDVQKFSSEDGYMSGIDFLKLNGTGQAWRNIYSRTFLECNQVFFTPGIIHEDGEFNLRAKCLAKKIAYLPSICYYYYFNRVGSIMNSIQLRHTLDYLYYSESAEAFIKKWNLSALARKRVYTEAAEVIKMSIGETLYLNSMDKKKYTRFLYQKKPYWIKSCLFSNLLKHKIMGLGLFFFPAVTIRFFRHRKVQYLKKTGLHPQITHKLMC